MDDDTENVLEEVLQLAVHEPAYRPQFYDVLMRAQVYIIGEMADADGGGRELEAGSRIQIQHLEAPDGSTVVPFFSSIEVLEKSVADDVPYLQISVRALFEITEGENLHLNPMSNCGKAFSVKEVARLLDGGSGMGGTSQRVALDTPVTLGQPANYPYKMVDSLTLLFAQHMAIKKAYLALMHDDFSSYEPRLIVGVEAEGDVDATMRLAAEVAAAAVPDGDSVGMYVLGEDDGGISRYLRSETKPFYERKWGARLWSWLGSRRAQ